ncbi:hypothetical protein [Vibrio cholerae]|uniref:hypothetical protein n=1 Tax=Vibrio cholerae TaxID=666 RepID=UPI0030187854
MSRNIVNTVAWEKALTQKVIDGVNGVVTLDFNRFRYFNIPITKKILANNSKYANRDIVAYKLFEAIMENQDYSDPTKYDLFITARLHFRFCDSNGLLPLTKDPTLKEIEFYKSRQRRGEIIDSTLTQRISGLKNLLKIMEVEYQKWMPNFSFSGKSQSKPTAAYSDNDLRKLLALLHEIFKQLHQQFISRPQFHIDAGHKKQTMVINLADKNLSVRAGITKLMCCATFLLSFYTWCNSSILFQLKRPEKLRDQISPWYKMSAFKRRAFKNISVELGDNQQLELPKYARDFFTDLIDISTLIDPSSDALLFQYINSGKPKPITGHILNDFIRNWLSKNFPLVDDSGQKLIPVIRRFRVTGSYLTLARGREIEAALLLDNTPEVIKRSYSSGNPLENNLMNRDTCLILEQTVRDGNGVEAAKKVVKDTYKIEVLTYESYLNSSTPPIKSANGSYCKGNNAQKNRKFTRRANSHGLIGDGVKLACAELKQCWECSSQVLVESVTDIWCILSYRENLEESHYLHIDKNHHSDNFAEIIESIDKKLKKINPKVLRQAQRKLDEDGRHPLWPDAASEL